MDSRVFCNSIPGYLKTGGWAISLGHFNGLQYQNCSTTRSSRHTAWCSRSWKGGGGGGGRSNFPAQCSCKNKKTSDQRK
jgi:hypothetical protein